MSAAAVLRGEALEMTYQAEAEQVHALRGVSLALVAGEFLLLMGPSGSGKTTLVSILGGLLTPTGGSVIAFGEDLTAMNKSKLARFRLLHIGFVFQGFNLFGALNACENVQLVLALKGERGAQARQHARELLAEVGLGAKTERLPRELSAGEKQRVAIARALAGSPPIVMADEPTASLDSESGHAVTALLRSLAKSRGSSVLTVTHDARIAEFADRVVLLEDGVLRALDNPAAAR
jgi:putative ABC transport system ATP-binding protein